MRSVLRNRRAWMEVIALVVGLIFLSLPTLARDAGKGDPYLQSLAAPDPRITVKIDDIDLQQALALILRQARVNFIIHPDVPMNHVTINLHEQPLSNVLDAMCKLSEKPIHYEKWHGIYRVYPVPTGEPGGWKKHSGRMWVNLGMTKMRLGVVLCLMMEQFGMDCSVDAELNDKVVTIQMYQPYDIALDSLQNASGTQFHVVTEGRKYHFLPIGKQREPRLFFKGGEAAPGEKRVGTIDYENAEVPMALASLLNLLKVRFENDDVYKILEGATVSIRMENVPLSRALTEIGKASSIPFTFKIENSVYRFTPVKK